MSSLKTILEVIVNGNKSRVDNKMGKLSQPVVNKYFEFKKLVGRLAPLSKLKLLGWFS